MAKLSAINLKNGGEGKYKSSLEEDAVYQELLSEYKEASPQAIETSLLFLRVAAQVNIRQEATFSQFGLTSGRFSLLMLLRREVTRSLSPSELAKRAGVARATMTQFIDALEKAELVKRVDDPSDRRAMLIQLTSKGDSLLKKVLPVHLHRLSEFSKGLNQAERKKLLSLMEKLVQSSSQQPL